MQSAEDADSGAPHGWPLEMIIPFLRTFRADNTYPFLADEDGTLPNEIEDETCRQHRAFAEANELSIENAWLTPLERCEQYRDALTAFAKVARNPGAIIRLLNEFGEPSETIGEAVIELETLRLIGLENGANQSAVTSGARIIEIQKKDLRGVLGIGETELRNRLGKEIKIVEEVSSKRIRLDVNQFDLDIKSVLLEKVMDFSKRPPTRRQRSRTKLHKATESSNIAAAN